MQRRAFLALALPAALAACGADHKWASDAAVRQARYVANEPPSITLFTVIGIPRGEGGHSGSFRGKQAGRRRPNDPAAAQARRK